MNFYGFSDMKIKSIRIKNGFKRFFDLTIDLGENPKRIIALVGSNGCGKSSVFDAVLYAKSRHMGYIGKHHGRGNDYFFMNENKSHDDSVKIVFDKGEMNDVTERKRADNSLRTLFSFRSPYRYNNQVKASAIVSLPPIKENSYGAALTSEIDDRMEQNYLRLHGKYHDYMEEKNCTPMDAKRDILGQLNDALRNCLDVELVSLGNVVKDKGTLYFKKVDQTEQFSFNVLSSGEKEVVDIILDLYLRKDEYTDTIFLIDEPELHINASIQRKLLTEINKLIEPDCQIWVATHSIGFLRALQKDFNNDCDIIYFDEVKGLGNTQVTLKPSAKTPQLWKRIFSIALDDLTGLVSPKRIIYCEGRAEPTRDGGERGMDAIVYNNIFCKKYPDTLFVSSGGNTEPDKSSAIAITILSKVFTNVEIWVLKDRDLSSSSLSTEQDRQNYLRNNEEHHRVLNRFEIENYLFDKSVLKSYCEEESYPFDETAYHEFVNDVNNMNLKDNTGRIKNICNITHNINPEKFKINLSRHITEGTDVYRELEECIFNRQ